MNPLEPPTRPTLQIPKQRREAECGLGTQVVRGISVALQKKNDLSAHHGFMTMTMTMITRPNLYCCPQSFTLTTTNDPMPSPDVSFVAAPGTRNEITVAWRFQIEKHDLVAGEKNTRCPQWSDPVSRWLLLSLLALTC